MKERRAVRSKRVTVSEEFWNVIRREALSRAEKSGKKMDLGAVVESAIETVYGRRIAQIEKNRSVFPKVDE